MCYCDITSDAGIALSDVLENARSSLEVLNLSGNRLGGLGFEAICKGLIQNTKLLRLGLADNMIDQVIYILNIYNLY